MIIIYWEWEMVNNLSHLAASCITAQQAPDGHQPVWGIELLNIGIRMTDKRCRCVRHYASNLRLVKSVQRGFKMILKTISDVASLLQSSKTDEDGCRCIMRPNEQCTVGTRGIDAKNIWTLQTHGPCGLLRRLINGVYYAVPSVVRFPRWGYRNREKRCM